ncbi:MAG: hypothetical protein AB1744_10305, partial [Candidatus Zixiibacteriota bacterium]
HPESLAALYSESQGEFSQRLVVGNLRLFDKLNGKLTLAETNEWLDSIRDERYFMPADLLPDHPLLTETPPNYLFVHPGARSQRTQHIVAMVFSSDISDQALANILEIARLSSMLRDTQFSASSELLALFLKLSDFIDSDTRIDDVLMEVFKVLDSQLIISRLVLAPPTGPAYVVSRRQRSQPHVRLDERPVVAAALRRMCSADKPFVMATLDNLGLSNDEAKRYYLDDVRSEAVIPIRMGGNVGIVAIGSPVSGDYLTAMTSLLTSAARFLSLWSDMVARKDETRRRESDGTDSVSMARLQRRLQAMNKLTGGDSKDILNLLSQIRSHTVTVRNALSRPIDGFHSSQLRHVFKDIAEAVDRACGRIGHLRDICTLTEECFSGDVSIRAFLAELPMIVRGYTDQMARVRKIPISVNTRWQASHEFSWPWSTVFDTVFTLLLALIDEATQPGVIEIGARIQGAREEVEFRFDPSIFGDMSVEAFLRGAFDGSPIPVSIRPEDSTFRADDLEVSWSSAGHTRCRVTIARPADQGAK